MKGLDISSYQDGISFDAIKNKKITRNISAGMYVLSTYGAGCMVDTVMQISAGDPVLISVAVNKNNYTNEMITKNKKFGISYKAVCRMG